MPRPAPKGKHVNKAGNVVKNKGRRKNGGGGGGNERPRRPSEASATTGGGGGGGEATSTGGLGPAFRRGGGAGVSTGGGASPGKSAVVTGKQREALKNRGNKQKSRTPKGKHVNKAGNVVKNKGKQGK